MDTLEGNELIASFMGWEKTVNDNYWFPNLYPYAEDAGETTLGIEMAKFHSDWNWLMDVVEKIQPTLDLPTLGRAIEYLMSKYAGNISYLNSINDLWLAVVDYLKWYKNQDKII